MVNIAHLNAKKENEMMVDGLCFDVSKRERMENS
jgi:hypothetical protein